MKYWSTLPHSDVSETAQFIDQMIATPFDEGEDFVVEFNGIAIGKAGFWKLPEIGFIFHPEFWGMGLATEAVSALVEYGLQERKITKIVADVDPRNTSSIRLLENIGFRETHREAKTIRIGDEWCDSVYFAFEVSNTC